MIKRIGLILACPFLFVWMAVSMIMSVPIWIFTGKGVFGSAIDIMEDKYLK
jgi:hypothetical protein